MTSHDTSHLGIVDSDKSGLTLTVRADEDEDYSDVQNDRTTCILGARASLPAWGDCGLMKIEQ